jgi:hypothetical protein
LGAVDAVVRSPADRELVEAVLVVGVVVCADADRPETASTATTLADSISLRGMCICFMALLLNLEILTAFSITPSFSDRLQAGSPAS